MKKIYSLCAFSARLAMFLSLSSCIRSTVVPQPKIQLQDLYTTLVNGNTYTILAAAVKRIAGYKTVQDVNDAEPAALSALLSCHLIRGRTFSSDFKDGSVIQTLGSASIKIGLNSIMTVSAPGNQTPALVVLPNRVTSNGAVFFINEVLKPGTGQSTSSYESGANEFGMGSYSANKIYRGQQSK